METVETFIKFFGTYPFWAKVGMILGLAITFSTAVFSPRSLIPQAEAAKEKIGSENATVFMRIEDVKLFPANENTDIQVFAFVNGTSYKHPNVAGIEWMKVGPNMSHRIIELPNSSKYEIRFELRYKEGTSGTKKSTDVVSKGFDRMASQMISQVLVFPFTEVYNLYKVDDESRHASISASVKYTIYKE